MKTGAAVFCCAPYRLPARHFTATGPMLLAGAMVAKAVAIEVTKKARKAVESFNRSFGPKVEELRGQSEKIIDACHRVGESWSGSWAGYHARLYYDNFERPPLEDVFNVEWGGLHGFEGWQDRSPDEVRGAIEKIAGVSIKR